MTKQEFMELDDEWRSIEFAACHNDAMFKRQREIDKLLDAAPYEFDLDTGEIIAKPN